MAIPVIALVLGLVFLIAGVLKRSQDVGRWLIIAGVVIIVIAVFIGGYGDLKTGFMDAMRD